MTHPLSEAGEFCSVCERTIEWDGHSEVAHLKARIKSLEAALREKEGRLRVAEAYAAGLEKRSKRWKALARLVSEPKGD